MKRNLFLVTVAVALVAFAACQQQSATKEPKQSESAQAASTSEAKHAPTGVKPGSHEDWCDEHQVPESMCTRCNPALIAAFKATNDWCAEHGLPESQCRICNPDLKIERPPKQEGAK